MLDWVKNVPLQVEKTKTKIQIQMEISPWQQVKMVPL